MFACYTVGLPAQPPDREPYRRAYREWREPDAALETDAATAGAALATRAQRAIEAAVAFTNARAAFLDQVTDQSEQQQLRLQNAGAPPPAPVAGAGVRGVAQSAAQAASAMIAGLAGDADPAIEQLRQALERERANLDLLQEAIQRRQQSVEGTEQANKVVDETRAAALADYAAVHSRRAQSLERVREEGTAWRTYYQFLADGARGIGAGADAPTTYAPKPSITPVPLVRYLGNWTFPANGTFKGWKPETADAVVQESGGHVTGSVSVRFILPPDSPADPVVRFRFEGDLRPELTQAFPLLTAGGVAGTVTLTPASAFNLLEFDFQTEPEGNKIRNGNFVLLKR